MKVNCRGCNHENCVYVGTNNNTICKDYIPLNPAPQQRTFVGFTDDEWSVICEKNNMLPDFDLKQEIEAILKEKNSII